MLARILLVIVAMALVLSIPAGTHPAEAKAKKKKRMVTVSRTFSSSSAVTVPPTITSYVPSPYPLPIQVSGLKKGKILDVDVVLRGVYHPHPETIDIALIGPDGSTAILMSDVGGEHPPDAVTIRLSDQAGQFLPDSGNLTSGSFQTSNYGSDADDFYFLEVGTVGGNRLLSAFNGTNPNGRWAVYVVSDSPSSGGSIGGVDLIIKAKVRGKKRR